MSSRTCEENVAFCYTSEELFEEQYPSLVTRLQISRSCAVKNVAVKVEQNLLIPQM